MRIAGLGSTNRMMALKLCHELKCRASVIILVAKLRAYIVQTSRIMDLYLYCKYMSMSRISYLLIAHPHVTPIVLVLNCEIACQMFRKINCLCKYYELRVLFDCEKLVIINFYFVFNVSEMIKYTGIVTSGV